MAVLTNEQIDKYFNEASETYDVDVDLLKAVGKTESGFDTNAYSNAGAVGIMQLMPNTFKAMNENGNIWDAQTNINAGAKYLSILLNNYEGNVEKALAGYNAGENNVNKYGWEKYSNYVNTVQKNYEELTGNDTFLTSNSSKAEKSVNWWGQLLVVILAIIIIIIGIVFLGSSIFTSNTINDIKSVGKKVLK